MRRAHRPLIRASHSLSFVEDASVDYTGTLDAKAKQFSLKKAHAPTPTVSAQADLTNATVSVISGGAQKVTAYNGVVGLHGEVVFTNMAGYLYFCQAAGQPPHICVDWSNAPAGSDLETFVYATGPITLKANGTDFDLSTGWNLYELGVGSGGGVVVTAPSQSALKTEAHYIPYSQTVAPLSAANHGAGPSRTISSSR